MIRIPTASPAILSPRGADDARRGGGGGTGTGGGGAAGWESKTGASATGGGISLGEAAVARTGIVSVTGGSGKAVDVGSDGWAPSLSCICRFKAS
jgi:hypothetical protein